MTKPVPQETGFGVFKKKGRSALQTSNLYASDFQGDVPF
ncbi:MAG: hypothetical protein AVDCRST_MAG56-2818 [uncultured Cytophagales bacterium]|uniref:Uncharacterized protein n=1 Tax=uncultured Cytophagales bacterium TaxID=158755 RepID=A0A6J4J074_9SPHI|nr:MAG: hypothetical protein AVDCRST_MAG56-2818 [uncultured Cytophagales bacterium]